MTETVKEVKRIHPAANCEVCPLYGKGVAKTQFPTGRAKAAIVSRSPGYHDTMAGRPFAGPSGQVLDYLLKQQGVTREDVLLTNVVLCQPNEGKVPPAAIKACAPRLTEELNSSGASIVLAAGSEACSSIIGAGSIDSLRGYALERTGRRVIATNNPALVLRDDSTFPNLKKDFRRAFNPMPEPTMPRVVLIEDVPSATKAINQLRETGAPFIGADVESRGGLSHKATLVCLQLTTDGRSAIVFGERLGLFQDQGFMQSVLRPFFESTDHRFIWHNGIFDTKILRHTYGIHARVDEDTLLLSYACDERGGVHELEYLLMEEFAWPYYTPQSVISFKKTGKLVSDSTVRSLEKEHGKDPKAFRERFAHIENNNYLALYKYAGYDAAGTFQLFQLLGDRAKAENVWQAPYKETLLAAEEVIHHMETTGMPYDFNRAAEMLEKEVQPEMDSITAQLRKITGKELLNPGSYQQMAVLYYDEYKVHHAMQQRPDMSRSADESARKEMIDGNFVFDGEHTVEMIDGKMVKVPHPKGKTVRGTVKKVAELHDRYAKLSKQAGTYLTGLIKEAELDPESRIYTSLLRHGTTSARLASRGPNLQNVTRTKEGLPDIRGLFYALDGTSIVQADYSQAELRTIAALSGDRLLAGYYERGESLHAATATKFYGEDYTPEQYSNSKNMNFGVFYRQSADTFLEKHEIPVAEAQKYIDWVWSTFTTVAEWEKDIEKQVHENKYRDYTFIESPFGNRRRFYLITKENKNAVYREAINFLPQNIAALITVHACILLLKEVDLDKARLCLTVHDSILGQVQDSYVDDFSRICQEVMVSIPKDMLGWTIPFAAEIGVGKTWATAK